MVQRKGRKSTWNLYTGCVSISKVCPGPTDVRQRWLLWAWCQSITPLLEKYAPNTHYFWEGPSECIKGKSEVTTYRVRTLWLSSLNLKATLKTFSGKGVQWFSFPDASLSLLCTLKKQLFLSLHLCVRCKVDRVRWPVSRLPFSTKNAVSFLSIVFKIDSDQETSKFQSSFQHRAWNSRAEWEYTRGCALFQIKINQWMSRWCSKWLDNIWLVEI